MKKIAMIASAVAFAALAGQASAATYTVSGDATASFAGLTIPLTITGGSYDDATGQGTWTMDVDLAVFGQAVMTLGQNWTMGSASGTGSLSAPYSCTGAIASTCTAVGSGFQGAWSSNVTPVVAGDYIFTLPGTQAGDVAFNVTLTGDTPEVPLPAAAWLFGSALVGMAGVARRRKNAV